MGRLKNGQGEKSIKKRSKAYRGARFEGDLLTTPILHEDDPFRRMIETERDLRARDLPIGKLRLDVLKHAREMPISDDGSLPSPTEDYIYSQASTSGKSNWLQIGPTAIPDGQTISSYYWPSNIPALISGRITSIVIDHDDTNVIYVGTALGGVWKTKDCGRNWVATSDYAPSLAVGALAIDPNPEHTDTLYAGTGEGNLSRETEAIGKIHPHSYYGCGILKTTDGGKKWMLLGGQDNPFIGASFFRIAINPSDSSIVFAATSDGLFRSVDAGNGWTPLENGLPPISVGNIACTDIVVNPADPNIAYAAFRRKDSNDHRYAGVYKTTNANDPYPSWKIVPITDAIDLSKVRRISLTISRTPANILYALMTTEPRKVDHFYRLADDGTESSKLKRIPLPSKDVYWNDNPKYLLWEKDTIGDQGDYNLNVAVDPENSDIVYLSGVSLWKATREPNTDTWEFRDIGLPIHGDHHAFAFDPKDHRIIYAGSDGGLYKSVNGGETWSDTINEGFCITQFEFMDHHPTSDAVIFGGTQDNGTLQYRNSPAFYFSEYGDGGFVSIDKDNPNIIIHQYTYNVLRFSKQGGEIRPYSWEPVNVIEKLPDTPPPCLFYAPFTLDQSQSKNIAFGADKIYLDDNQGHHGWKTLGGPIELDFKPLKDQRPAELISALNFVNSSMIYAATIYGKVFRVTKTKNSWQYVRIDDGSLPSLYIWDITTMPDDPNTIIVVMAGYASEKEPSSLIWRGILSKDKENSFEWEPINGTGIGKLPPVPINAIVIDDKPPNYIYIGTDIGVFRSSNKGSSWIRFSENLPVCAVYDMRLSEYSQASEPSVKKTNSQARFLRIATHGRGIWERQLDIDSFNDINLFVRDNLMDTGYLSPSPTTNVRAAFSDPLQNEDGGIRLNDVLTWDMCSDIKIDSPNKDLGFYQFDAIDIVDYIKFESRLQHRNPKSGDICNIYVQIHNRGIKSMVENVTIKLFYASMAYDGTYPQLPADFWTSFSIKPESEWKPILPARSLPEGQKTLTNTEPTILVWQWHVPSNIVSKQIGILVVVESPEDPIPPNNKKVFDVQELVTNDRRVGLRTVNIA
jgi:hypothetical protein